MPEINQNGLINFDHGIKDIVFTHMREQVAQNLPERRELSPSNDAIQAQLSQLLEKPNTAQFLQSALRPEILDRDLLMPTHFAAALKGSIGELSTLADSRQPDGRMLNRAVRLLKEETDLRELVAMYRSALYQG